MRRWILVLALAGCQTYKAKPLDPEEILRAEQEGRRDAREGEVVDLGRATELMLEHSPRLREVRALHAVEQGVADTPVPLPNPRLELAPTRLNTAELLGSDKSGVDSALGWTVFLDGRIGIQNELNALVAEFARIHVASTEREEYLGLRREFSALAVAALTVDAQEQQRGTLDRSLAVMHRLVEAAQATALDVRELQLERYRVEATVWVAHDQEMEARGDLATRTGTWSSAFEVVDLPPLPEELPDFETLHDVFLRDHPELARLRAEYLVVEKRLRLEIARQYPALDFGLLYERDGGVSKWGIGIGIDLPIFDRNQPGIARAHGEREEVRARFEAAVARGLAHIEKARARLERQRGRYAVLKDEALPASLDTRALVRRSLSSGAADSLRFLAVLRVDREVRLEFLEATADLLAAWSELEDACGAPLLRFPGEPGPEIEAGKE